MNTTPTTLPDMNPDLLAYFPPTDAWKDTLAMGADALREEKDDLTRLEGRILTVAALARRVLLDAGGDFTDTNPPLLPELPQPPGVDLRMMLAATRAALAEAGEEELPAALERLQDAAARLDGPEDAGLAQEEARAVLLDAQLALLKVRHWRGVLFGLLCGRLGVDEAEARAAAAIAEAEAREEDAKAERHRAMGEADAERTARERAEAKWQEAEEERRKERDARIEAQALADDRGRILDGRLSNIAKATDEAKHAAAGAHAEATRSRVAAEAAATRAEGAERAAMVAATAARGDKRDKAYHADLVQAFRAFDAEWKEAKAEWGEKIRFLGESGFLDRMRANGLCIGSGGAGRFKKIHNEWVGMGRPDAEAYRLKRERR